MMKKDKLPIGTVVLLNGGAKEIMITGYNSTGDDGKSYDYNSCVFPEGFMENKFVLFNEDQIHEIIFRGYESGETLERKPEMSGIGGQLSAEIEAAAARNRNPHRGRTIKAPTKPMSISEMRAKYVHEKISGGQDEKRKV